MKSNYRKIGDHIRLVDERNAGLTVKQLLGLSISKGLAEAHNGQLTIDPTSQHTCFQIILPREQKIFVQQAS